MSRLLTLEVPDELYAAMERAAQANAQSLDAWLLRYLPLALPISLPVETHAADTTLSPEEAAMAALIAAEHAATEADWRQYLAEEEERRQRPPLSREEARAELEAILAKWRGEPITSEQALELAMSEEIAEWNLDLD
ncbi:MAG: hypothetical protein HC837_00435 [Chloroflexaceae bacterium]|nr:hypothetical protein [Chloroflexaceae bacterium]